MIGLFVAKEMEQIDERIKGLSDRDRLNVLIKLLPFALPVLRQLTLDSLTDEMSAEVLTFLKDKDK